MLIKRMLTIFVLLFSFVFLIGCKTDFIDSDEEKVILLYSASDFKSNGYSEIIDNYKDYQKYEYDLDLSKDFFKDKLLYTYSFLNNNIGSELYRLFDNKIEDNRLKIMMKENMHIASSPAFGGYTLVFSIDKDYYKLFSDIDIIGISGHDKGTQHTLILVDPNQFFIGSFLDYYYYEGEKITLQTAVIYDVDLELYVNDIFHSTQTPVEKTNGYIWEFYFEMPNQDVILSFKVIDGFKNS